VRNLLRFSAVGVLSLLLAGAASADKAVKKTAAPATCGEHGTSLHFEDSPSAAAKKALKEEKLVMVLHISGYFEDPDFT